VGASPYSTPMDILVTCCDKNRWALGPFSHQFNQYWPNEFVMVAGYDQPGNLPDNFNFHSLGRQEDFPAERWSDALLLALSLVGPYPILMLEDYWLTRDVDTEAVHMLLQYMREHPNVLRMDLTTDRLYAKHIRDAGPLDRLDLIQGTVESEYQLSFQAAIWNASLLRQILQPGWTPWEAETVGSTLIGDKLVMGTRQAPVRYLIAIKSGKFSLDGSWQYPPKQLEQVDIDMLTLKGLLEGAS